MNSLNNVFRTKLYFTQNMKTNINYININIHTLKHFELNNRVLNLNIYYK